MSNDNVIQLIQPGIFDDQLTEVLRNGARALLAKAVEAEVADFLGQHADLKTRDGHQRVVRHGLCDVESTRGDAAESKCMCAYDQSAQPCTGATTRIEEPDRACAGPPQVGQFLLQNGPDAAIRVRVHAVKDKRLRRIAIGITDIIVSSLVVDVSDVIHGLIVNCRHRISSTVADGRI